MAFKFNFEFLREENDPRNLWAWAQRLVEDLNRFQRIWELASMDLTGQGGKTVKVKADETGFELV